MLAGRYTKDYALEERVGPDGIVRTDAVYVGPRFRFREGAETVHHAKRTLCVSAAIIAAAALVPLLVVSPMLRLWYVMIPLALAVLPAARLAFCAVKVQRRDRFTRRERDLFVSALAPWSGALAILSVLSLLGQALYVLRGGAYGLTEGAVFLAALVLAALSCRVLSLRRSLATEEAPAE